MPKIQSAPSGITSEVVALNEKQRQGRAINAVAEMLKRKLLVPRIFLDLKNLNHFLGSHLIPKGNPLVDVLAIDRAGSGDIHGVHIHLQHLPQPPVLRKGNELILKLALELTKCSGLHFKYIAVGPAFVGFLSKQNLFAEDGIGRVGIIEILESPSTPPEARVVIQAERFRVDHSWIKKFDSFQKKTTADMEIRD